MLILAFVISGCEVAPTLPTFHTNGLEHQEVLSGQQLDCSDVDSSSDDNVAGIP